MKDNASVGHDVARAFLDHSDMIESLSQALHGLTLRFECRVVLALIVNILIRKL